VGLCWKTRCLKASCATALRHSQKPASTHILKPDIKRLAKEMAIRSASAFCIARDMGKKVLDAVDAAVAALLLDLAPGPKTLALQLQKFVLQTTRQTATRIITE